MKFLSQLSVTCALKRILQASTFLQCCVVDFVEKLNSESLNLSEEQFQSYMRGDVLPEGTNNLYMCDGLRLIHENSIMIRRLKERQEQCLSTATDLEQRLLEFRKEYVFKVHNYDIAQCINLILSVIVKKMSLLRIK